MKSETTRRPLRRHRASHDAEREYAYDRPSKIGQLDKAWDEGEKLDRRRYKAGLEDVFAFAP